MTFPRGSTRSSFAIKSGDLIGNYRIDDEISSGGMGTVHRATHVILPRRAAVKVLHADLLSVPSAISRMVQEARILEALVHPGSVRVFETGTLSDGRPWLAMELVDGCTLAERASEGALPMGEAAGILMQLCDVLALAHRSGILHRDVKPENILLTPNGVKLIDWGIAQTATSIRQTQVDVVAGTPHYLAPELLRGEPATTGVDTYALGVLGFEILVGEPPFSGETAIDIAYGHLHHEPQPLRVKRPDLPVWLEQLLAAMMDKQPANRPSLHIVKAALMTPVQTTTPVPESDDDLMPTISIESDEGGYYYDELAVG